MGETTFRHRWSDEVTLVSTARLAGGYTLTSTASWSSPDLAHEMRDTAVRLFEERAEAIAERRLDGDRRRVRVLRRSDRRTWFLTVNTGPPTWWWPRAEVKRTSVMVGWLRGLVALSWPPESDPTPATEPDPAEVAGEMGGRHG